MFDCACLTGDDNTEYTDIPDLPTTDAFSDQNGAIC